MRICSSVKFASTNAILAIGSEFFFYVTRKTVSKMTYNVSSGKLNSTIPKFFLYVIAKSVLDCANHAVTQHPASGHFWEIVHVDNILHGLR